MSVTDEYLKNNEEYAKNFSGPLPLPPSKHVAVVACMDARLDVYRILGLNEGEAHVIRNAGGVVTDDVIRSLAISQRLLGTKEIILIHHTDCGMLTFTNEIMSELLDDNLETASFDGKKWSNPNHGGGSVHGHFINWHTIKDLPKSVVEDVTRIRTHPLVPRSIPIYGFIYDCATGRINEVKGASAAGKPAA